jgi:hypothetical protein
MSHCELRTPWPSPTIWWIKFHNSEMKNRNFTKKYTDCKTINSNIGAKFEVNLAKGFSIHSHILYLVKMFIICSEFSAESMQGYDTSLIYLNWMQVWIGQGVLNSQCDIRKITYNFGIPISDCPSVRFTCHTLT